MATLVRGGRSDDLGLWLNGDIEYFDLQWDLYVSEQRGRTIHFGRESSCKEAEQFEIFMFTILLEIEHKKLHNLI